MAQMDATAPKVGATTLIQTALNTLAMLAFAFSAMTGAQWVGYTLGALALVGLAWRFWDRGPSGYVAVQLLILGGFLVDYDRQFKPHPSHALLAISGVIIMALLLNQATFKRVVTRKPIEAAHLPGARFASGPLVDPRIIFIAETVLVLLTGVSSAAAWPVWPLAVSTFAVAAVSLILLAQMAVQHSRAHLAPSIVRKALEHHRPEFVLYFSAPIGNEYHVEMWLPYLERLGRPFVIILRESWAFEPIAAMAKSPVILCKSVALLENAIVASMRAAFFVNNGAKNAHMVRFNQLTHIQLLHGDSDKTSSYNPVTAMFDKVYVAGQAAVDRYAANGVYIEPSKFVVVGRPQVETIRVATRPIREASPKTVLYATTWSGLYTDANYSSLRIGSVIIRELLNRDVTVIFRPHPLTGRIAETAALAAGIEQLLAADKLRAGRNHIFGAAAQSELSLFECFNRADAMISDVSGVASDFLYSEKPLAMTDMIGDGPKFVENFPLAKAAYVLRGDASNLTEVLDDLLDADPLARTRRSVKEYYLGDFPAETYADGFVRAARAELAPADRIGAYPG